MFYFIQLFAFGLLLGVPMKSAGLKCYYNNNGCDLIENNISFYKFQSYFLRRSFVNDERIYYYESEVKGILCA